MKGEAPKLPAVRSIAWLDVRSPPVNQSTNHETANAPQNENRNILACNDGVRKADEQTKQQTDKPTRPSRQLNATNDESNGEAAGKRAEQSRGLVGKRHRQHKTDIERSEH